jgi:hypothetical protein
VYIDLKVLPGTSVNCKQLFNAAKFMLINTRNRTSPKLFEALLLLKVDRNKWNSVAVGKAMGRTVNSNVVSEEDKLDMLSDCLVYFSKYFSPTLLYYCSIILDCCSAVL